MKIALNVSYDTDRKVLEIDGKRIGIFTENQAAEKVKDGFVSKIRRQEVAAIVQNAIREVQIERMQQC